MTYLLDTNIAIAVIRNRPVAVRERLRAALAKGAAIAVPTIATYELWYGVAKSTRQEDGARLVHTFLSGDLEIIPFTDEDAAIAGRIRAQLEAKGTPIGPYDLLIAAQAIRGGHTLVTADSGEFGRVDGLTWEDWANPQ